MLIEVMVSSYCMCLKLLNRALFHKTKHETKSNNNKMKKKLSDAQGLVSCFLREKYIKL